MSEFPGDNNALTDGNGEKVKRGDRVEYRFGARLGSLLHVAHDGEADVQFDDVIGTENVKWHHLCKVSAAPTQVGAA